MTTALYRRYRPDTFADMIGQEHVTGPLMQALRSGRVNHAYLFSGPRGCGKTTSARILARTLNCHRNTPDSPLDTPCGECESCTELARGGPGSLDVVEIDAASHNGVDDARDLRERATFAPARDRYKIFILDEAHMVTPQGFNALLKIVEEPPPHIKFVFATTEPDKVIGTIRSRTHHYPFRLVPPDVLSPYLEKLSDAEGIKVGSGVLPLVTRAGGGSVRDSLSVMDQLIAGASGGEVGYDLAVGLLGYTHSSLLDDVVDALAVRDGASIFRVVDQIIATGHEPRRFVEDVLERLRDLIVIGVSGEAADAVLRDLPTDQLERMRAQAGRLGVAELSRAADLVNTALTEMTGATSPRLHLELLCARLLLPGADDGAAGLAARIDRLERGGITTQITGGSGADPAPVGDVGGGLTGAAAARAIVEANRGKKGTPGGSVSPGGSGAGSPRADESAGALEPARAATPAAGAVAAAGAQGSAQATSVVEPAGAVAPRSRPAVEEEQRVAAPRSAPPAEEPEERGRQERQPPAAPAQAPAPAGGAMTTEEVRRRWPEVLETLSAARVTWSLVGQNAQVASLDGGVLKLAFRADGLARAFANPRHTSAVEDAVSQTLGIQVKVEGIVGDGPGPAEGGGPAGDGGPGGGGAGGGAGPDGNAGPRGNAGPGSGPGGRSGQVDTTGPRAADAPASDDQRVPGSTTGGAPSASASASAETDGWPEVPVPGGQPNKVTGTAPGAATSRGVVGRQGTAGGQDAGDGRSVAGQREADRSRSAAGGPDDAGDPAATDDGRPADGQSSAGDKGASSVRSTADRSTIDDRSTADSGRTTTESGRATSDAEAVGVAGGPGATDGARVPGGHGTVVGQDAHAAGSAGPGSGRDTGSAAVAVAERAAPTRSSTSVTEPGPAPSPAGTTTAPDEEPVPEPPPGYDDDLEPSGGLTPKPPPVPESVYATQSAPSRLTGADRAREALRRAQAARSPGGAAGGTGPTGVAQGAKPAAGVRAASYDEMSADDPDLEAGGGLVGVPLVVKVLGGTVIDEKIDQA